MQVVKDIKLIGFVAVAVSLNMVVMFLWAIVDPLHVTIYNQTIKVGVLT